MVGVEVAGVLVGLDDERRRRCPSGRSRAGRRVIDVRQQRPDEARRVRAGRDEDVDEPAGRRALAVGSGDADQRPADGRIGDDLLPRLERDPGGARGVQLRMVGVDRGERLGDREAVRVRGVGDVGRVVLRRDDDAERVERRRVRRGAAGSQPDTTAPARGARSAAALAPAPAAPTTWIRSPGRIGRAARGAARGRLRPGPRRRSRRGRRADAARAAATGPAAALSRLFARPVARPDVAPDRHADRVRDRDVGQARPAWRRVPPSGPAMPVTATARSAPGPFAAAGRHRHRDLGGDRAVRGEDLGRDADALVLELVRIGHEAADERVAGAGDSVMAWATRPPGARFDRGDAAGRRQGTLPRRAGARAVGRVGRPPPR